MDCEGAAVLGVLHDSSSAPWRADCLGGDADAAAVEVRGRS